MAKASLSRKIRKALRKEADDTGLVPYESYGPGDPIEIPDRFYDAILCGPKHEIAIRNWRVLDYDELTRAEKVMMFAETYLKVPEGILVGQPLRLAIFQELFFYAVFDNPHGTRRAILSMGRKNAKTVNCAIILLAYICGPEAVRNSMCCSGAMSKEQAALVHRHMSQFIDQSEELKAIARVVPSGKRIFGLNKRVEFQALAKEGSTSVGRSDLVIVLDESGQIIAPTDDFVESLITSQGAYGDQALQIVISTQAADDKAMLSQWIDDAERFQDPNIVCHLYTSDPDADLLDEEQWRRANPALGIFRSESDLRKQLTQAARLPSLAASARNLLLNQRVATSNPFLTAATWDACKTPVDPEVLLDGTVYGGLDLSSRNDLTSMVIVGKDKDTGMAHLIPFAWTPKETIAEREKRDKVPYQQWVDEGFLRLTPGSNISYKFLAAEIAEICRKYRVKKIAFDRWRIDVLKEHLEEAGAHHVIRALEPYGQGYKDMSPACDEVEHLVLAKNIAHGAHPVLRWCVSNTIVTQDPAGNRKPDKSKSVNRIDVAVAMMMAVAIAQTGDGANVYSTKQRDRGLLIL
jgi:phage terminase large subunit-like protein